MTNIDWELGLKTITVIVAICGLWKGIREYQKSQKWKKAEFLSKEIKEMLNDFNVKRALLMIDWNVFQIPLLKDEIKDKEVFYFTDRLLESALVFHEEKEEGKFTHEEALIRIIFDTFFDKLSTLQNYIDNGLFSARDLAPYIIYYIKIMGEKGNGRKLISTKLMIHRFITKYDYTQVTKLFNNYGYEISCKHPVI